MKLVDKTSVEFVEVLASKEPVPGGGGASALVGAIGIALGNMVASLTLGKKKYAEVETDILRLQVEATELQNKLLSLVDKDAEDFEPLAKAYGIPKDDPNRAEIMENALKAACETPLEIMRTCAKSIDIIEEFAEKGSSLALSDAAVGAVFAGAALQGASYNVYINTKSLTDRAVADKLNAEADELNEVYLAKAEKISSAVYRKLKGVE